MKFLIVCTTLLFAATVIAQQGPPSGGQQGPPPGMPAGAPSGMRMGGPGGAPQSPSANASVTIAGKTISIAYSSPRVKGREGQIFTKDGLIQKTHKSYPVWRGGANAATTLKTDANLTIGNLNVPAGTYTLFIDISDPARWVLIVSKDTGEWGLSYDSTKDLGRVPMQTSKPPVLVENLEWKLTDNGGGKGMLTLAWEDVTASVQFTVH